MKKLIVILGMLISMCSTGQVVYSKIGYKHTEFIYYCCERLRITGIDIVINYTDKNLEAYSFRYNDATYVIGISRKCSNIKLALAHELYHIFQDIRTDFDINKGTLSLVTNTFINDKSKSIEKDANKNAKILIKDYGITGN